MHYWNNRDIDWAGIGEAASYIGINLRRWGRVNVSQTKEKYGTARVYCSFGVHQPLHELIWPGYAFRQMPQWLWNLDIDVLSPLSRPLNWILVPYQKVLYTYYYGRALEKWPHLRKEILGGADWPELLCKYQTGETEK